MALDLNTPSGREVMYRLVERSDVFLSNVTVENLEKWEVTYERLREINPRLVYAVCTGYGHRGRVTRPSFDLTVQALTGIMRRIGEPGEPPIYVGMGSGDAMGGLMAAFGILVALHGRRETGRGQFIDASLYGAQLFMAAPTLQGYLATGDGFFSTQRSRRDALNPLWNTYPAADKWLYLCMENTDEEWALLCRGLDDAALGTDERFRTPESRRENRRALVDAIDEVTRQRTAAAWMERWQAMGVTVGPINNLKELSEDPQAWENGYLMRTHCDEVEREVMVRGLPVTLSRTPGRVHSLGPELGQHTEEILVETLGYSWERVAELKAEGAIL
jgi:crotonobetainyl-CoA:carnitine CoA-transferase CaiB-like acyl-CoA transferase